MATKKKLLQAAAGTAAASGGAGGLNVEQVFSTYLYEGNGSSQVIDNGINLGQSYGSGGISLVRSSQSEVHTSSSNDFAYGSGDFTWEAWIMPQVDDGTLNSSNMYIFDHGSGGSGNGGTLTYNYANGGLQYYDPTNSVVTSTQTITNYTWAHVAVVRVSGILKVYYNGSQIISFTSSHSFTDTSFIIGGYGGGGLYNWQGVISEVRVSNTARYTNTFTPPTATFTSDSNTILLTGQGSTLVDNSSNSLTLTAYGDAEATSFGPFDAADAGEGGLVWVKERTSLSTGNHELMDTERGTSVVIFSDLTNGNFSKTNGLTSFNSNGFSIGSNGGWNNNTSDFASWTFRKAPKFFTCLTYTGTGTAQNISHDLGSDVGFLLIKRTDSSGNWRCWHRGLPGTGSNMEFNQTGAYETSTTIFNGTDPTSTQFSVGTNSNVNASGGTYVAYLFAHNNGDGDFGPTGDQDIIKCGSFTGNNGSAHHVELGFEPQWLLVKNADLGTSGAWWSVVDMMRGMSVQGNSIKLLKANSSDAEANENAFSPTATGFNVSGNNDFQNNSTNTYIYIAIRRGPMAVPTDATDVFDVDAEDSGSYNNPPLYVSGFPVDFALRKQTNSSANWVAASRLTGTNYLQTNSTAAESSVASYEFDYMNGWSSDAGWNAAIYSWMWKRAPNFCDVVAYTGNSTAGRTVSHNLGVAPEMMWIKRRNVSNGWKVYHSSLGAGSSVALNETVGEETNGDICWNSTAPTDSVFSLGAITDVNGSGDTYIAYLFASLDGVSKVGSVSHTSGTPTNVDCGFSAGARFIILKRYDAVSDWWVFDTERGIAVGNDARLILNNTNSETSTDQIDPYSAGFTIDSARATGDYIFYAIA